MAEDKSNPGWPYLRAMGTVGWPEGIEARPIDVGDADASAELLAAEENHASANRPNSSRRVTRSSEFSYRAPSLDPARVHGLDLATLARGGRLAVGVSWRTPDTYHMAGLERGTGTPSLSGTRDNLATKPYRLGNSNVRQECFGHDRHRHRFRVDRTRATPRDPRLGGGRAPVPPVRELMIGIGTLGAR